MLGVPSAQQPYDDYYSGDPAFVQLAATATDADRKEHQRKIRVARQTGDWSPLLIDGQKPTRFVMRRIPSEPRRKLRDMLKGGESISNEWLALVFRAALVDVAQFGDFTLKPVKDSKLGLIAAPEICDLLDERDELIVNELALVAWMKATERDPT